MFTILQTTFYKFETKLITVLFILFIFESSQAQTVMQTVIGNTAGPGAFANGPIYRNTGNAGTLNYSRYAYVYTAAELNIPSGSKIIKLEWCKKDTAQVIGNNIFNVWISNTNITSFVGNIAWNTLSTGATQEFSSSTYQVTGGAGSFISAPFNDSFIYNGSSLQILTDWEKLGYATAAVPFFTLNSLGKAIGIASTSPLSGTSLLQSTTYGGYRPTIRITYVTVPSCAGTPNPGNTLSSKSSACPGIPFTLTTQNNVNGGLVTYQWQSANNISFTSGLVNLGTNSNQITSQTSNKYYRCVVTCGVGPISGTSTPLLVPMSPSYGCYCTSTAVSNADEDILKFKFGSIRNCSDCGSTPLGIGSVQNLYGNYQSVLPATIQKGTSVPFSVEIGVCSENYYPNVTSIFIDYNQNNSFNDAGELVYSSASPTNGAHIESGNITIPTSALNGLTGLRIINSEQSLPITNPCLVYSWGETEDYLININSSSICSGMPTPGNTIVEVSASCNPISSTYSICSGKTALFTIQTIAPNTGYTYQWYNGSSAIVGATSAIYQSMPLTSNQTFYCSVTCTNSGLTANSVPISITMAPFINCYCNSVAASNSDEDIFEVNLNGNSNTSDCLIPAIGSGSILNRYSNFTTLGNFSNLTLGSTLPFYIDVDDCDIPPIPYYSFGTSIWIDFNHNGSFEDIGEQVFVEPTSIIGPRIVNGNITIPCSALLGQTKMRIVIAEGLAGSNLTPCMSYNFGETEDYIVNLIAPTACVSPVPSPGATLSTITILCDSSIATLSVTNKCLLSNYTFQWYKNSVAIPGATNNTYTTPKIFATTTYYCRVNCGSNFSNSLPITITKPNFNLNASSSSNTYCTPGGTPVSISATGALTYSYSPTSSLSSSSGSMVIATPSSNTTYTVIGTDANGCTKTSTVFIQVTPCGASVNLKLYIQAYYIGSNLMAPALLNQGVGSSTTVADSITVEFHNANSPYTLVDTKKVLLNTNGTTSVVFPSATQPYYLAIKHRNALTTWTSIPIQASIGTYDFTTSNTKAFGNNMVNLATNKWAFYSGDILHDDNIDLLDLNLVEIGIEGYYSGYHVMDLNGDGNVDLLDTITLDPNIADFIYAATP